MKYELKYVQTVTVPTRVSWLNKLYKLLYDSELQLFIFHVYVVVVI